MSRDNGPPTLQGCSRVLPPPSASKYHSGRGFGKRDSVTGAELPAPGGVSYWLLLGSLPAFPAPRSVCFPPQTQLPKARPVRRLVAISCTHRHTHPSLHTHAHVCAFTHACASLHIHVVLTARHARVCPCVSEAVCFSACPPRRWPGKVPRRGSDAMAPLFPSSLAKPRPSPSASALCPLAFSALAPWRGGWFWRARLGHEACRLLSMAAPLRSFLHLLALTCSPHAWRSHGQSPDRGTHQGNASPSGLAALQTGDRQPPEVTAGYRKGLKCLPAGPREDTAEVPRGRSWEGGEIRFVKTQRNLGEK